jgi:nucleoside-diphosphate-sugar epimerase
MKLFLTGGTGFIGSHFINQAHVVGHEIVALRRSPQSTPRIPLQKEPTWIDGSMTTLKEADFAGCDALVHLAAHSANVPYDTLENCIIHNVIEPLQMFRTAIDAGLKRFIVAGSCFEFGRAGERYEFIPADAPLEPSASYPASKAAASVAFYALACEKALQMDIMRIFQVYGEGELETRFWPSLRKAAQLGEDLPMSEGKQIRDFVNVTEVARQFVAMLDKQPPANGHARFSNVGSGIPMSLREFAEREWLSFAAQGKLLFGAIPVRQNEVMRFVPSV